MTESVKLRFGDLEQAAEWFAILGAGDVDAAQTADWQRWLDESPEHRRAWHHVEQVNQQVQALPGAAARMALLSVQQRRRSLKKLLSLCTGIGLGTVLMRREQTRDYLAALSAGHRTEVGQIAAMPLSDGTRAWLNTDSAAEPAYHDGERLIVLHRGEILLHSGADSRPLLRPLVVKARDVRLRALGTRFSVRLTYPGVQLAVYDGAVAINDGIMVPAGSQVSIINGQPGAATPVNEEHSAWSRKMLIATQMRLDDFLNELGRYRHGHLACDPALAHLRLVGIYPLDNTDQVLDMLEGVLPVRIKRPLPWWVTVAPR